MVGRQRPIEFQLLGITPPAWEPVDSLAVGRLLAWRLAENHQAELVRGGAGREVWRTAARDTDRACIRRQRPAILQTRASPVLPPQG